MDLNRPIQIGGDFWLIQASTYKIYIKITSVFTAGHKILKSLDPSKKTPEFKYILNSKSISRKNVLNIFQKNSQKNGNYPKENSVKLIPFFHSNEPFIAVISFHEFYGMDFLKMSGPM